MAAPLKNRFSHATLLVPSEEEWTTLITWLGGGNNAGGKMKESGTSHWDSPNPGATNESGFSGLPGGYRSPTNGSFLYRGLRAALWSSTENNLTFAHSVTLYFDDAGIVSNQVSNKDAGYSVRCLKDN